MVANSGDQSTYRLHSQGLESPKPNLEHSLKNMLLFQDHHANSSQHTKSLNRVNSVGSASSNASGNFVSKVKNQGYVKRSKAGDSHFNVSQSMI